MNSVRAQCFLVAFLIAAPAGFAQGNWTVADPEVIRKNVNEVQLTFTVTDSNGRSITGLTQNDFSILDDGRPAAKLKEFSSATGMSLHLCVLIDSSASVSRRFRREQEVAIALLTRVIRRRKDKACVIQFARRPLLLQEFTGDVAKLGAGVQGIIPAGDSAVWDAVRYASELMSMTVAADPVRRVIVLIGDGEDNASAISLRDAIDSAVRCNVEVQAVVIHPSPARAALYMLASLTGGLLWEAANEQQFTAMLSGIEQSWHSEYLVAYEPAGELAPGRFRKIEVNTREVGATITHRSGYYVPVENIGARERGQK